ncbi:MAG TPA: DUF711 family protein [Terriglobales bacterium]|nr:DUF711 family protein [Terriglobales bacterium]
MKPKIRAVTAFVTLDRSQYQKQITDAVTMLKRARTIFESRGYPVETIRIATQPFPEYSKGLTVQEEISFFRGLDAIAAHDGFILAIGPAMLDKDSSAADANVLGEILASTKAISGTVAVAGDDGVHWQAVGAAARVMKRLENTEHSQGNFRFAAMAMVKPMGPFFPAAYNVGFGHQFAVGLESANVVAAAFKDAPDLATARQRLIDELGAAAFDIQHHAQRVDMETGWRYAGMDLSPAPAGNVSIGGAMETLTQQPFGSSGTLTAAATITAAIKSIAVQQAGYSGLMLPILEDARLAQRWNEGRVAVDALLAYSAVCATGLDTVPLPGNVTEEQLDLMIGDMASLAVKWGKPLTARLLPVAGRQPGDKTDFTDPNLINVTLPQMGPTE